MDLKQLPPATSNPPFIAGDLELLTVFEFRVLRQNRRLAVGSSEEGQQALDTFHGVLEDVAYGNDTQRVREALVAAYVRGAQRNQETVGFVSSTACVTKRRYRDTGEWGLWGGNVFPSFLHFFD